jgi:hypothetical protein
LINLAIKALWGSMTAFSPNKSDKTVQILPNSNYNAFLADGNVIYFILNLQ